MLEREAGTNPQYINRENAGGAQGMKLGNGRFPPSLDQELVNWAWGGSNLNYSQEIFLTTFPGHSQSFWEML